MTGQPAERPRCPECGGRVSYDLTCHTWPRRRGDGTEAFMACLPCDSAIEYVCVEQYRDPYPEDCDWRYTHGLNPRNPRSAANEVSRPPWIPAGQDCTQTAYATSPKNYRITLPWTAPGVPMLGEDDGE